MKNKSGKSISVLLLAGLLMALSPAASAATLGTVTVLPLYYGKAPTPQNAWGVAWGATWGPAWDKCRKTFPATRSIEMRSYRFDQTLRNTFVVQASWACRNTK